MEELRPKRRPARSSLKSSPARVWGRPSRRDSPPVHLDRGNTEHRSVMPASPVVTTTVAPSYDWAKDLTPSAKKGAEKKAEAAADAIKHGDEYYLKAAHRIEEAYRLYLKGDRKRLDAFCATAPLNLKGSMGYEYVKAAKADRAFGQTIKDTLPGADIGVRGLAMLARFVGDEDAEAEGAAIIVAEVKAAKAEGRKPLSVDALQKAVTSDTGATPDREATRVARICRANEAVFASQFRVFTDTLSEAGTLVAFIAAGKYFAELGAKAGAATPLAVASMGKDLADLQAREKKEAARQQRQDEQEAAKLAADFAAIELDVQKNAKPAATVKPVAPAANKRTGNKPPKSIGVESLVKTNAPDDGGIPRGFVSDPRKVDRKTGKLVK